MYTLAFKLGNIKSQFFFWRIIYIWKNYIPVNILTISITTKCDNYLFIIKNVSTEPLGLLYTKKLTFFFNNELQLLIMHGVSPVELDNKSTKEDFELPLSYSEFLNAIKKFTHHKTAGLNGIPPNTIKALNEENRRTLFDICVKYFDGEVNIKEC